MLNYIRKYKWLYYLPIALFPVAPLIVLLPVLDGVHAKLNMDYYLYGFLLCMFIPIWARICNSLANKCYMKRTSLLNDRCDPKAFLKANEYTYRRALRVRRITKPRHWAAVTIFNNQIIALLAAGQHEEALRTIDLLDSRVQNSKNYADAPVFCLTARASAYLQRNAGGDIAAARECVVKARELLGKQSIAENIANSVTVLEYRLDAVEGKNLQTCLEYFTRQADNSPSARVEAIWRNVIALIYRQLGDTENERAQLETVVQKAPEMHIGKQAAQRLEALSAQ